MAWTLVHGEIEQLFGIIGENAVDVMQSMLWVIKLSKKQKLDQLVARITLMI